MNQEENLHARRVLTGKHAHAIYHLQSSITEIELQMKVMLEEAYSLNQRHRALNETRGMMQGSLNELLALRAADDAKSK
jgi:hypothetical protein